MPAARAIYSTDVTSLSFFNETNYLRMCWNDLHQILTTCRYIGGDDQLDIRFTIAHRTLVTLLRMLTNFLGESAKIGILHLCTDISQGIGGSLR